MDPGLHLGPHIQCLVTTKHISWLDRTQHLFTDLHWHSNFHICDRIHFNAAHITCGKTL